MRAVRHFALGLFTGAMAVGLVWQGRPSPRGVSLLIGGCSLPMKSPLQALALITWTYGMGNLTWDDYRQAYAQGGGNPDEAEACFKKWRP